MINWAWVIREREVKDDSISEESRWWDGVARSIGGKCCDGADLFRKIRRLLLDMLSLR